MPRKSVRQMVKEYRDIIQPPEQFLDGYKPIPKPRTDRPLQMQKNQNARRPPKPQRSPPPPTKRKHEGKYSITDKPSSKIKELRMTVPLVSYIRTFLRFWYYVSLSTCCQNLEKNWGHQQNIKCGFRDKLPLFYLFCGVPMPSM